jgi:cation-transporting ATPase 13A2
MALIAGSSSSGLSHDYTEGASAVDIDDALANSRRSRRDSHHNTYYDADGEGAMFSGPGHTVNPSSVSRMSHIELGRKSSDLWSKTRRRSQDSGRPALTSRSRRSSVDTQVSRQSLEMRNEQHVNSDEESLLSGDDEHSAAPSRRRRRRKSLSPPARITVFENLAHLFGRGGAPEASGSRRLSVSQRSSTSRASRRSQRSDAGSEHALDADDDEEERWGYSSGEEDSDVDSIHSMDVARDNTSITASMEYDSDSQTPSQGIQALPMLEFDSVFGGEARIDMEMSFTREDPPPVGPPSRQTIYIPDEDSTIRFVGYETLFWRVWIWRAGCLFSLGLLALIGHWFPRFWLHWVTREKPFIEAYNGFIVVEVCLEYSLTLFFF